jgi:L-threonylcarbamoyladenylate synthase
VALPTETVYGLGGLASSQDAVRRIFHAKGRPVDHPLIVHVADAESADYWAEELPPSARALMASFWPGPLTLVVPRAQHVLDEITGGQPTIALRAPQHELFQSVLANLRDEHNPFPGIAAPSANRFGRVSPTIAEHVIDELSDSLENDDMVLDGGACAIGVESTIAICRPDGVLIARSGGITGEQLERHTRVLTEHSVGDSTIVDQEHTESPSKIVQQFITPAAASTDRLPRVPGSLASHYAPTASVYLIECGSEHARGIARIRQDIQSGALTGPTSGTDTTSRLAVGVIGLEADVNSLPEVESGTWLQLLAAHNVDQYAHDLYHALRSADQQSLAVVIALLPEDQGVGTAIRDRLTRASSR